MKKELWEWLSEHEDLSEEELSKKLHNRYKLPNSGQKQKNHTQEGSIDVETWWEKLEQTSHGLMAMILTGFSDQFPPNEELIGKSVGKYTLLELIGAGGMGRVFLAERNDGVFERKVAVKLMKFSTSPEQLKDKFSKEQRILASLSHASIAQLYDASITEAGSPYFVMEWVKGVSLTEYIKANQPSGLEVLKLFMLICEGVEYAHKNLVIHKDLKPGNILVDKNGIPKILDFGVADFLENIVNEGSFQPITLAYASPELIRGEQTNTSTDIFSLGVILFELLTGTKPFFTDNQTKEERVSNIEEGELSFNFKEMLPLAIGYELRAIITRALKFHPEDRYSTIADLKQDIEKILHNRPISLLEDKSVYVFKKWIQRNMSVTLLSGLFIIASLVFGVFYITQVSKERALALEEAQKATVTKEYLLSLFEMADPLDKPGEEQSLLDFLNNGIQELNALDSEPEIKEDASYTLARVAFNLGAYHISDSLYQVSYDLNRLTHGAVTQRQTNILDWRANISIQKGHFRESIRLASTSFELKKNLFKPSDPEMETSYSLLSRNYARLEMLDSAVFYLDKAKGNVLNNPGSGSERLITLTQNTALLSRKQGDFKRSVDLLNELVVLLERNPFGKERELATAYNNLGFSHRQLEKYEMAVQAYDSSLQILERVFGDVHPNTFTVMGNLAGSLTLAGELERAEETYIERLENIKAHFGENHWRTGQAYFGVGGFYRRTNQLSKARESFKNSAQIYSSSLGSTHFWTNRAELFLASVYEDENESLLLFKKSIDSIKKELSQPLSYYDIGGLNQLLEELDLRGQEKLSDELVSFLDWYKATFNQ